MFIDVIIFTIVIAMGVGFGIAVIYFWVSSSSKIGKDWYELQLLKIVIVNDMPVNAIDKKFTIDRLIKEYNYNMSEESKGFKKHNDFPIFIEKQDDKLIYE